MDRLQSALHGKKWDLEAAARALSRLEGVDSPAAAKGLFQAGLRLETRVEEWDRERVKAWIAVQETLRGKGPRGRLGLQGTRKKEFAGLMQKTRLLRERLDRSRPVLVHLRRMLESFRNPEALKRLAKAGLSSGKVPFRLRLAVARAVGSRSPQALDLLGRALARADKPGAKAAVLEGLLFLGKKAAPLGDRLLRLLKDPSEAVREGAVRVLAGTGVPKAVLPMILLLGREKGMVQERIASRLEAMTGMKLGLSVPAWRRWYEEERGRILSGEFPLGASPPPKKGRRRGRRKGRRGRRKAQGREKEKKGALSYYMGIPQTGKALVYLLDASNSMKAKTLLRVKGTSSGRDITSRFDACRRELIKSISALSPDQKFNVIFFNDLVLSFRPEPVPATKKNVAEAVHWILQVRMRLLTDIYSALQLAFSMVSGPKECPYTGNNVDTIFLLTDGAPYIRKAGGKTGPDKPAAILQAVSEWDPLERVKIHCITVGRSLGKGVRKGFLRRLAALRGGEFREY